MSHSEPQKPDFVTAEDWQVMRRLPAHFRLIAELIVLPPEAQGAREYILSYLNLTYESGGELTAKNTPRLVCEAVNYWSRKAPDLSVQDRVWLNRIYDAVDKKAF